MKKIKFNDDWRFILDADLKSYTSFGLLKYSDANAAAARFYDYSNWAKVMLPHDWATALPKHPEGDGIHGSHPNSHWHHSTTEGIVNFDEVYSVGWYRKQFTLDESFKDKRIFLEFEGIYRDAVVWVNGVYMDRHASGYIGFLLDITDHVHIGEENAIAVRVDSEQHEGWWYEGSGIYRNAWLHVGEPLYLAWNQTVVKADVDGTVRASAVLVNDTERDVTQTLTWTVTDPDGRTVAIETTSASLPAYASQSVNAALFVNNPRLWHVDNPNLYTLTVSAGDETSVRFGFRSVAFDADRGFLLNGKPLKLRGACVHQDFGGVGVALTDNLQRYKIHMLKEMGVNAYRCSHHAPAPALLDACDELGMLVLDETRMFGTAPEAMRQLQALVERDRNHPSIFCWCIGNEEFSVQNLSWSYRLTQKAKRLLQAWDDTRPCTYAGNNGANFEGANAAVDVRGINYIYNGKLGGSWVDTYHREHPEQPIMGTEESSYVLSRVSPENDLGSGLLDCFGNVTMPWGSTPKGWVKFFEKRPYLAGGFMWTGFDYRGEPIPFSAANHTSAFGTIDLCGIPKPPFYYYRAWWTDEPVLKLTPHWQYRDGENATVTVYTNCPHVTLTLNGKTVGTYDVEPFEAVTVTLPFEAGVLRAVGERHGLTYTDELITPDVPSAVTATTVWKGETDEDISIVELRAVDKNGNLCPLSEQALTISLPEGQIIGVCNGNPADFGYEQQLPEERVRYLRTFGTKDSVMQVLPKKANAYKSAKQTLTYVENKDGFEDDYRLVAAAHKRTEEPTVQSFVCHVRDVSDFDYLEFERLYTNVTVYVNGVEVGNNRRSWRDTSVRYTRPYRFYCELRDGDNEIRIDADITSDVSAPFGGIVKLGTAVQKPWEVNLHGGIARVFVRSHSPEALTADFLNK